MDGLICKDFTDNVTPTTGSVDPTVYTGHVNTRVNRLIKVGKMVFLDLFVETTDSLTFPLGTKLFEIPQGFRPTSNIKCSQSVKSSNGNVWYMYEGVIDTAGGIYQYLSSNAVAISMTVAFETN